MKPITQRCLEIRAEKGRTERYSKDWYKLREENNKPNDIPEFLKHAIATIQKMNEFLYGVAKKKK